MDLTARSLPLLAALTAAALATTGCTLFAGKTFYRSDSVLVASADFKGWRAVRMSNGEAELIVVPGIARVMFFGLKGGENLLWVNEALTPEALEAAGEEAPAGGWQNYGGYKLWPAPQADWNWPPPPELDRGPCRVEVSEDGVLRLIGTPSPQFGLRFDREISIAPSGGHVAIRQIAVNVSGESARASIWDVTQVTDECVGFVPLGDGAEFRALDAPLPDEQWRQLGDLLLVSPAGQSGKVFISGPPGWLGCRVGRLLYIKAFPLADEPPPEPETPREVFTGDQGYIELEIVGPAVTLAPGESTSLTQTWHLLPVGEEAETDAGLRTVLRQAADQLDLKW